MEIYVEFYLCKNIGFNFLLLVMTAYCLQKQKQVKWQRLLFASVIGALYAYLALFVPILFHSVLGKIAMGVGMIVIAFGKKEIATLISPFFVLAYLLAGILSSLWKEENVALLLLAVSMIGWYVWQQRQKKRNHYYDLLAYFLGEEFHWKAKWDTGNELKDGIWGEPVIVLSEKKAKENFPETLYRILKNERLEIPKQYQSRIRLISFHTIAGEGMKVGIQLDSVMFQKGNTVYESKAIAMVADQTFFQYDALIGNPLLEKSYEITKKKEDGYHESHCVDEMENERAI